MTKFRSTYPELLETYLPQPTFLETAQILRTPELLKATLSAWHIHQIIRRQERPVRYQLSSGNKGTVSYRQNSTSRYSCSPIIQQWEYYHPLLKMYYNVLLMEINNRNLPQQNNYQFLSVSACPAHTTSTPSWLLSAKFLHQERQKLLQLDWYFYTEQFSQFPLKFPKTPSKAG